MNRKLARRAMLGLVVYEGPSLYTNEPIAAILVFRSSNAKTGRMPHLVIIRRDGSPVSHVQNGTDTAICGACPYSGGRGCYVSVPRWVLSVWKAYRRQRYNPPHSLRAWAEFNRRAAQAGTVRLGSYGDTAALPSAVLLPLISRIRQAGAKPLNYTHGWRSRPDLAPVAMASVESAQEREEAKRLGFRTFRGILTTADLQSGEILCPASAEAGKTETCNTCNACQGNPKAKRGGTDIAIVVHGPSSTIKAARATVRASQQQSAPAAPQLLQIV